MRYTIPLLTVLLSTPAYAQFGFEWCTIGGVAYEEPVGSPCGDPSGSGGNSGGNVSAGVATVAAGSAIAEGLGVPGAGIVGGMAGLAAIGISPEGQALGESFGPALGDANSAASSMGAAPGDY